MERQVESLVSLAIYMRYPLLPALVAAHPNLNSIVLDFTQQLLQSKGSLYQW